MERGTDRIISLRGLARRGPGRPPEATDAELADATPATAELLRLMDATPVPCGQSAVTAAHPRLHGTRPAGR